MVRFHAGRFVHRRANVDGEGAKSARGEDIVGADPTGEKRGGEFGAVLDCGPVEAPAGAALAIVEDDAVGPPNRVAGGFGQPSLEKCTAMTKVICGVVELERVQR